VTLGQAQGIAEKAAETGSVAAEEFAKRKSQPAPETRSGRANKTFRLLVADYPITALSRNEAPLYHRGSVKGDLTRFLEWPVLVFPLSSRRYRRQDIPVLDYLSVLDPK
jgi:hypothetical protein